MLEKWSISRLSEETGMDRRTVKKYLEEYSPCDQDEKTEYYHLRDLIHSIQGRDNEGATNLEKERTRLTRSEANRSIMAERKMKNELLEPDPVLAGMENVAGAMKRIILSSKLTIVDQDALLNELRNLDLKEILEQQCSETIPEIS